MTPKSFSNPECGEETDSSIIGKYGHFSASSTDISYLEQYATLNMHIRVQLAVQALLAAQDHIRLAATGASGTSGMYGKSPPDVP